MLAWMKEMRSAKARNAKLRATLSWDKEVTEARDLVRLFEISPGVHGYIVRVEDSMWQLSEQTSYIAKPLHQHRYNAYVKFKKPPTRSRGYEGIYAYVPAHGGLTFAEKYKDGMVYGLDTAHMGDGQREHLYDLEWLENHLRMVARAILLAASYEARYLEADEEPETEKRYAVIDEYRSMCEQLYEEA